MDSDNIMDYWRTRVLYWILYVSAKVLFGNRPTDTVLLRRLGASMMSMADDIDKYREQDNESRD